MVVFVGEAGKETGKEDTEINCCWVMHGFTGVPNILKKYVIEINFKNKLRSIKHKIRGDECFIP